MVSNYLILMAIGLALLLSAPLHAAWTNAVDGRMLGKRMPASTRLVQQASAGAGIGAVAVPVANGNAHADPGSGAGASSGVVLLDFWAPGCVPCRDNVAQLNRLQRDYRAHGLTVVGMARAPPVQVAALAQRELRDYRLGNDPDGVMFAQLGLDSLPSAVLVDRNGIVVWQGDPANLGRATIERTLAAPALGELLRY